MTRRTGWLLVAVAVWNFVIWATFAKNLLAAYAAGEDRPTAYWIAHTVLIVANVAIGLVLLRVGVRALRARQASAPSG